MLPSCNNVKTNVSLTYSEITFCKLPSCNVPRSCPLRRHLQNTHVFLPSCALNIRSSSSTAASPEVHRNKAFRATEGFTQSSLSSTVHYIRRAVDHCRQQSSTFLHIALRQHPISKSSSLCPSTSAHCFNTHNHARLSREGISRVCPVAFVGRDRTLPLYIENPPQFLLFNQPTSPPVQRG